MRPGDKRVAQPRATAPSDHAPLDHGESSAALAAGVPGAIPRDHTEAQPAGCLRRQSVVDEPDLVGPTGAQRTVDPREHAVPRLHDDMLACSAAVVGDDEPEPDERSRRACRGKRSCAWRDRVNGARRASRAGRLRSGCPRRSGCGRRSGCRRRSRCRRRRSRLHAESRQRPGLALLDSPRRGRRAVLPIGLEHVTPRLQRCSVRAGHRSCQLVILRAEVRTGPDPVRARRAAAGQLSPRAVTVRRPGEPVQLAGDRAGAPARRVRGP